MLSWQFIILFHSQMFWRWWLMISVILKMTECTGTLSVSLSLSTCPILTPPSHIYKWLLTSWMCMRIINRAVFTSQLSSRRRRHTPDRRPTIHETDGPQNLIKNVVSEGPRDRHTCPPPPSYLKTTSHNTFQKFRLWTTVARLSWKYCSLLRSLQSLLLQNCKIPI